MKIQKPIDKAQKANCAYLGEQAKELSALLSFDSFAMVEANKSRALSAIDAIENTAKELRRYIEESVDIDENNEVKVSVPCKIGDYVWAIRKYQGVPCPRCGKVIEMFITEDMKLMIVVSHVARGYWNETVFPTYEDAVAAIEKRGE